MERKTISIGGKLISYTIAGSGKAVLLLHGFGADSSIWMQQIDFLKPYYTVIAPDLPGINASMLLSDVSMDALAGLVKTIMEEEEISQVTLIGHSMGGYAALAFAEKYPELLNGLGLFHSTAGADNDEKKETRKKGIAFTEKHGTKTFLESTTPKMFGASAKKQRPEVLEHFLQHLPEMSKEAVVDYYEAMMDRPDRSGVLQDCKVPVLFIYGAEDEIIPLEKTIEQASLPSVSTVHILKNSGHMGMIEAPAEANKALEDFLSDI